MESENTVVRSTLSAELTDVFIRVGIILFLVVMSVRVFSPFLGLLLWALILAVTLYPLHQRLANRIGGKQGRAATLLVLIGVLLIGTPVAFLATAFADFVQETYAAVENNTLVVPQPNPSVAEWPVVGENLYNSWSAAATNLPEFLQDKRTQMEGLTTSVLEFVKGTASVIFQFLFSLIIAGIMMAYGKSGSEVMLKISKRITGPRQGERLHTLTTATIRSVSLGVVGVALIQALLLGVGFVWADVPAAGLLAFIVLIFGIAQLPALLISLPVIGYVWWAGDSTVVNTVFTVYFLLAGAADNVLKPLLLGRGVEAPMPVILLGALGGMVSGGLIGLFVGAVFLAVGYIIFMDWVAQIDVDEETGAAESST